MEKMVLIYGKTGIVDKLSWEHLKDGGIRFENGAGHLGWDELREIMDEDKEYYHILPNDKKILNTIMN